MKKNKKKRLGGAGDVCPRVDAREPATGTDEGAKTSRVHAAAYKEEQPRTPTRPQTHEVEEQEAAAAGGVAASRWDDTQEVKLRKHALHGFSCLRQDPTLCSKEVPTRHLCEDTWRLVTGLMFLVFSTCVQAGAKMNSFYSLSGFSLARVSMCPTGREPGHASELQGGARH